MKDALGMRWNNKYFVKLWPRYTEQPAYVECINKPLFEGIVLYCVFKIRGFSQYPAVLMIWNYLIFRNISFQRDLQYDLHKS